MAIRVVCTCGRGLNLPDKYVGQHLQCPECRAMLRIPTHQEEKDLLHWACDCGLQLKARARSAGKSLSCPRCGRQVQVPEPTLG